MGLFSTSCKHLHSGIFGCVNKEGFGGGIGRKRLFFESGRVVF